MHIVEHQYMVESKIERLQLLSFYIKIIRLLELSKKPIFS